MMLCGYTDTFLDNTVDRELFDKQISFLGKIHSSIFNKKYQRYNFLR